MTSPRLRSQSFTVRSDKLESFFFQAEDGIRDWSVTGVQTCALPILRLFAEFKAGNDERLAEIERRSADVVTDEKVERINAALTRRLDELAVKSARPAFAPDRKSVV